MRPHPLTGSRGVCYSWTINSLSLERSVVLKELDITTGVKRQFDPTVIMSNLRMVNLLLISKFCGHKNISIVRRVPLKVFSGVTYS